MSNSTDNSELSGSSRPLSYDALKAVVQNLSIIQRIKMSRKSASVRRLTAQHPYTINELHFHYHSSKGTTITVDASWVWKSGFMRDHPSQHKLMRGLFENSVGVRRLTLTGSYPEWLEMSPIPEGCVVEVEMVVLPTWHPVSQLMMSEESIRCKQLLVEFDIAMSETLLESEFLQSIPKVILDSKQSVRGIVRLENPSIVMRNELLNTVEILKIIEAWLAEPRPLGAMLTMPIQHDHFIANMKKLLKWKFEHLFYDDSSRILLNETSILSVTMTDMHFKMVVEPISPSRRAAEMLQNNAPADIDPYDGLLGNWKSLSDPEETSHFSYQNCMLMQTVRNASCSLTENHSIQVVDNVIQSTSGSTGMKFFIEKGYLVIDDAYDTGFGDWKVFERASY